MGVAVSRHAGRAAHGYAVQIEEHAERAAAAAPGSALRLLAFDVGPLLLQLQEGDDTERAQRVQVRRLPRGGRVCQHRRSGARHDD